QSIRPWCDKVEADAERLNALIAYEYHRAQLSPLACQVVGILESYEQRICSTERGLPAPPPGLDDGAYGKWWSALVDSTLVAGWRGLMFQKCPDLVAMTPEYRERCIKELAEALSEKRQHEPRWIMDGWKGKQVPHIGAPWPQIFKMRGGPLGDAKRLREAIELGIPDGLMTFRPCWLTNPETAARLFPLSPGLFDVVIFDEASQCPLEQAIPAIYRANRVIVSGDEKQLPPTSFFKADAIADDETTASEAEDEEATDQEVDHRAQRIRKLSVDSLLRADNLLDAAVDMLPAECLLVHYRSEHPALINFSNRAFYQGRLEMPPGRASLGMCAPPIEYHFVTDGILVDRTNAKEAQKVVELLEKLWDTDEQPPTVGVVTFNQLQRELIENLLEAACNRNPRLAVAMERELSRKDGNQDVGFFVKNLENVQGDERDIMVFSTTFARPQTGQFSRRFGPVGAVGGERRLNVAITRQKKRVMVVSSMPINEIAPTLTGGGVGASLTPASYLQLYLAYVRAAAVGDLEQMESILTRLTPSPADVTDGDVESPLEEEVMEAIHGLGFLVDTQVGVSGFRIDLAVRHPDPGKGYVLGVECDGATYHSGWTARARDVWRQGILEERGWTFHRVWSTRWWDHHEEETARLREAIEASIRRCEHPDCC
ncbi:MAG: AAA domain-containing protein, partial [Planctomycetota bacterium]|nr:AAA domain-containing protein [Planctomycetota bacterium]